MKKFIDFIRNINSNIYWLFIMAIFSYNLTQYSDCKKLETEYKLLIAKQDSIEAEKSVRSIELDLAKGKSEIIKKMLLSNEDSVLMIQRKIRKDKIALAQLKLANKDFSERTKKLDSDSDVSDSLMVIKRVEREELAAKYEIKLRQLDSLRSTLNSQVLN